MNPSSTHRSGWLFAILAILFFILPSANAAPGDLDPLNLNIAGNGVWSTAVQPDGKTIVAGNFSSMLGQARSNIARLNVDGTLDADFVVDVNGGVSGVLVQADGKIVLAGSFTTVSGTVRNRIARVAADGTLDTGFNPDVNNNDVGEVAIQADGKILLCGAFTSVGGTVRNRIARVNADGSLDLGFDPNVNWVVYSVVVLADGKILLMGPFTKVGGTWRPNIARVFANGVLDASFNPNFNNTVADAVVQADGKIVCGGTFASFGGIARSGIARLNADGTLDPGFDPGVNNWIYNLAIQADGKILLGGLFTTVGGTGRNRSARLNADGTLDTGFNPGVNGTVNGTKLQADGKVLLGGSFTNVGGTTRSRFARLLNDPASQTLSAVNATELLWERSGTTPEVMQVTFEQSIDSGVTWTLLGSGSRIGVTSNWQLTGLSLPASSRIRARGRSLDGSGLLESVAVISFPPTVTAISPTSGSASGGTSVTITGTHFTGATGVTFGGIAATSFSVINAKTLTATTPAHATGTVSVLVTTPVGTNSANTLYTYLSNDADLTSLSLTTATINESFAADSVAYTSSVPNTTTSITVASTVAQPNATIQVRIGSNTFATVSSGNSSPRLALAVGVNTIDVKVTAQDGSTIKTYTITMTRAEGPEIAISGNGVEITSGDSTPSIVDDTYFGSVAIASGMITRTFAIANTGAIAMNLTDTPMVNISGAHASDFHVSLLPSSPVSANSGTTFQVTFDPHTMGLRTAVVSIDSDDADENPHTFAISGTGRFASQAVQSLVFTPPSKLYVAESPFVLSASSSSGLPSSFTLISGPAIVSGNVLTLTGSGVVKVRVSQPGNGEFLAATPVERTITVSANPTTLTLTNLSQTYTGTPREITILGATGQVDVTYKVGASYVSTAPTNAGSYPVKAVAGGATKTGTLVITKAPLFVTPEDQRKFASQVNPVLGFSYSGFLGSDNATNSVGKAPVIATTATATSAGGLYPITASGGSSANYLFVYQKGTMKIETFAGSYEALLVDSGTQLPAAKLELTVAASSKSFTGKLTTPTETAALSLNGTLGAPSLNETVTGTARVTKGTNIYDVTVTFPLAGDFTAFAKGNGFALGDPTNGRKLLTLTAGQTLSYSGAHSAVLAPATPGAGVPAGAGWAVAMIDAKGLLKLAGKLADGTTLTASLAPDVGTDPGYRLFLQPYTPARTGSFIAGAFVLKPQLDPGLTGRRFVAFDDVANLTWVKAPRTQDGSYRAGFGPVSTRFTLDPWLPPVPSTNLALRLGLSGPAFQFTAKHSTLSSASAAELPTTLALNATTNAVSVIAPANTTKWKVTVTPATGVFFGSFELSDAGEKRTVPFSGIMRQPPVADTSGLIGDGNFQLPALPSATSNEVLSGEIGFER